MESHIHRVKGLRLGPIEKLSSDGKTFYHRTLIVESERGNKILDSLVLFSYDKKSLKVIEDDR